MSHTYVYNGKTAKRYLHETTVENNVIIKSKKLKKYREPDQKYSDD